MRLDALDERRMHDALLPAQEAMERIRVEVPARVREVEARRRIIVDG
jgi:hypothetical protein